MEKPLIISFDRSAWKKTCCRSRLASLLLVDSRDRLARVVLLPEERSVSLKESDIELLTRLRSPMRRLIDMPESKLDLSVFPSSFSTASAEACGSRKLSRCVTIVYTSCISSSTQLVIVRGL